MKSCVLSVLELEDRKRSGGIKGAAERSEGRNINARGCMERRGQHERGGAKGRSSDSQHTRMR